MRLGLAVFAASVIVAAAPLVALAADYPDHPHFRRAPASHLFLPKIPPRPGRNGDPAQAAGLRRVEPSREVQRGTLR